MKIKKYADGSILDFLRKRSKTESIDTIPTVSESDPNFIGPVTPRDASGNLIDFADMKKRQRYAESSFRDNLTSPSGAIGRYQIMPITYKEYNQRTGKIGDLLDPNFNEELRDWYMNTNLNKYNALRRGNPTPLIKEYRRYAAYNMGPVGLNSALNKAIADGIDIDNTIDWISYLPKETQDYVNFIVGKQDIQDSSKTTAKYNAAIKKYGIYQGGGLVYNPFVPETKMSKQVIDEPTFQSLKISDYTRFPVEPVKTYNILKETPEPQQVATQIDNTKVEQPKIEKQKGTVSYKYKDLDVGNMQELIDLMVDEGMSFKVTSGNRPGAKTKSGNPSHHGSGDALDITPIEGQTWDDLIAQMKASPKFIKYMNEHGLGILDERSKDIQAKTGATGEHFHIGPDLIARTQFKYLIG